MTQEGGVVPSCAIDVESMKNVNPSRCLLLLLLPCRRWLGTLILEAAPAWATPCASGPQVLLPYAPFKVLRAGWETRPNSSRLVKLKTIQRGRGSDATADLTIHPGGLLRINTRRTFLIQKRQVDFFFPQYFVAPLNGWRLSAVACRLLCYLVAVSQQNVFLTLTHRVQRFPWFIHLSIYAACKKGAVWICFHQRQQRKKPKESGMWSGFAHPNQSVWTTGSLITNICVLWSPVGHQEIPVAYNQYNSTKGATLLTGDVACL